MGAPGSGAPGPRQGQGPPANGGPGLPRGAVRPVRGGGRRPELAAVGWGGRAGGKNTKTVGPGANQAKARDPSGLGADGGGGTRADPPSPPANRQGVLEKNRGGPGTPKAEFGKPPQGGERRGNNPRGDGPILLPPLLRRAILRRGGGPRGGGPGGCPAAREPQGERTLLLSRGGPLKGGPGRRSTWPGAPNAGGPGPCGGRASRRGTQDQFWPRRRWGRNDPRPRGGRPGGFRRGGGPRPISFVEQAGGKGGPKKPRIARPAGAGLGARTPKRGRVQEKNLQGFPGGSIF